MARASTEDPQCEAGGAAFQRILDDLIWATAGLRIRSSGSSMSSPRLHAEILPILEELHRAPPVPPQFLARYYEPEAPPADPASRTESANEADVPAADDVSLTADLNLVASHLKLTGNEGEAELTWLRRNFAAAHHPDRVLPEQREMAMRRMANTNRLIDRALAELRDAHRSR
jgi:hypothetical protein